MHETIGGNIKIMKRKNRISQYNNFDIYYPRINKNKKNTFLNGKKKAITIEYEEFMGKTFNIDKPQTFNEKINARKIEKNPLYKIVADKYKVRKYVESKLGTTKNLIPLIFVGKNKKFTSRESDALPQKFILKTTNGSGTNIIVIDKEKTSKEDVVKTIKEYLTLPFWWIGNEHFYPKKSHVIVEQLLLDKNGKVPKDYKFHCFRKDGKLKIFIQVDSNRFENHTRNIYDEKWNLLDVQLGITKGKEIDEKPEKLKEMLKIAEKLSEDFNYIRVDLFYYNKKIYFGELTLTHGGGLEKFIPEDYDYIWGSYWG